MKSFFIQLLLWPFSLLYRGAVGLRNRMFDLKILPVHSFDIPVISVGNITVGGTGKTPFVQFLLSFLSTDLSVATLSRGYKRKTKGFQLVETESRIFSTGDEPIQIKRKFPQSIVAVDKKRVHGIRKLKSDNPGLKVIILDDAFQHRYVKPDISIVLIDFNRQLENDHFLPLGRLRENPHELKRAQLIVVTKCPDNLKPIERRIIQKKINIFPYQKLFFTTLGYDQIQPVFPSGEAPLTKEACKKREFHILLVTGIANTRPLRKYIRSISPRIKEIKFPDHHYFTEKDIKKIIATFNTLESPKVIFTTEKDAMRLSELEYSLFPDPQAWYFIPVFIKFLNKDKEIFQKIIVDYVTKNKRHGILFTEKD